MSSAHEACAGLWPAGCAPRRRLSAVKASLASCHPTLPRSASQAHRSHHAAAREHGGGAGAGGLRTVLGTTLRAARILLRSPLFKRLTLCMMITGVVLEGLQVGSFGAEEQRQTGGSTARGTWGGTAAPPRLPCLPARAAMASHGAPAQPVLLSPCHPPLAHNRTCWCSTSSSKWISGSRMW